MEYSLKDYFGGSDTAAYAAYKQGQKEGKWTDLPNYLSKGGTNKGYTSYEDTIKKAQQQAQQAVQPAVQSYQAQIPEVKAMYEQNRTQLAAEKDPLISRYQGLLDQIKGRQQTAENRQTVATSGELGKRGIVGSSTLAQQEMANAVNPITSEYTGMIKDTGLAQEADLRSLANQISNTYTQQTQAERDIQNMIGQLLGNAGMTGLNMGQQQQQFNQNLGLSQIGQFQQADQFKQQQDLANKIYQNVTLPQSQYAINAPYYKPDSGSSGTDFSSLFSLLGLGGNSSGGGYNYTVGGDWEPVQ